MSHFAKITNDIVEQTIVAEQEFVNTLEGEWIQTSYRTLGNEHPENRPLRGNFASVGDIYDRENDVFYKPQPYPSWILNRTTWLWEAPVPLPDTTNYYKWDENSKTWINPSLGAN